MIRQGHAAGIVDPDQGVQGSGDPGQPSREDLDRNHLPAGALEGIHVALASDTHLPTDDRSGFDIQCPLGVGAGFESVGDRQGPQVHRLRPRGCQGSVGDGLLGHEQTGLVEGQLDRRTFTEEQVGGDVEVAHTQQPFGSHQVINRLSGIHRTGEGRVEGGRSGRIEDADGARDRTKRIDVAETEQVAQFVSRRVGTRGNDVGTR